MLKVLLALAVTAAIMCFGLQKNSKFKVCPDGTVPEKMRKYIKRNAVLFGVGIIPIPSLLAFYQTKIALIFLAITLFTAVMFIPRIMMSKLSVRLWLPTCMLIGIGSITRFLLMGSIIGIVPVRHFDNMNRYGAETYWKMYVRMMENDPPSVEGPSLFDILSAETPKAPEPPPEPEVEVWREDGLSIEYMKVSRDGQRYYNPDDGEWHKIKK